MSTELTQQDYSRRYYEANKEKVAGQPVVTRQSERRDCSKYQECLTQAAFKNIRVVPCADCRETAA